MGVYTPFLGLVIEQSGKRGGGAVWGLDGRPVTPLEPVNHILTTLIL